MIQNLPLRGYVEKLALQDGTNVGKLLSLLRFVTQFYTLLAIRIKPNTISYLPPHI